MTRFLLFVLLLGLTACKKEDGPTPSLFPGRTGPRVETVTTTMTPFCSKKKYYYDEAGRIGAIQHYDYDDEFGNCHAYTLYQLTYEGDLVDVDISGNPNTHVRHQTIRLNEQGQMIHSEYISTESRPNPNYTYRDIITITNEAVYGENVRLSSLSNNFKREVYYDPKEPPRVWSSQFKKIFEWGGDQLISYTFENKPKPVQITYYDQKNTTTADFTEREAFRYLFQELGLTGDVCTYIPRKVDIGGTPGFDYLTFEYSFDLDDQNRVSRVTRVAKYDGTPSPLDSAIWEFTYYE